MKKLLTPLFFSLIFPSVVFAQAGTLPQDFLFDDSDIIIKAPENPVEAKPIEYSDEDKADAISQAKKLLNQKPAKLQTKPLSKLKRLKTSSSFSKTATTPSSTPSAKTLEAPFGLIWEASISDTETQGVSLTPVEMKDYVNSFLATRLPKPIPSFNRVYAVYGKENELYRILAYSQPIDDDASASKALKQYNTFSELLNKKYGNKEEFFTPATITKKIKNSRGQEEISEEKAAIGNPEFLSQLESGSAVLFSTYYNSNVAAALSIGVDGDKKTYIVIDYKNLHILKEQEAKTLDAL